MNPNENIYDYYFQFYAGKHGQDWLLLKAQVKQESDFNPNAVSPAGAEGLSQFMPQTWLEWEDETPSINIRIQAHAKDYRPFNPEDSIRVQAAYMAWLREQVQKLTNENITEWTLAAYNWGIGNVKKEIKNRLHFELAELPIETKIYVKKILTYYDDYKKKVLT